MIWTTRDGKKVEIASIEYGSYEDDGTFVAEAYYVDIENDIEAKVPDSVLEELTEDYGGELQELWYERQLGRAEHYWD